MIDEERYRERMAEFKQRMDALLAEFVDLWGDCSCDDPTHRITDPFVTEWVMAMNVQSMTEHEALINYVSADRMLRTHITGLLTHALDSAMEV